MKQNDWLFQELAFITWLYKHKNFIGSLKRKDFHNFLTREKALKEFYKSIGEDRCSWCGGGYQQIGKDFNEKGHKILKDSCQNCGHTRER